ncbi:MAG: PEP-CTERM sorting domain-containing protein [Planctomycetota bacterium]
MVVGGFCSPVGFYAGDTVDNNVLDSYSFTDSTLPAMFGFVFGVSHTAMGPGTFLGFKDSLGRYGYIEVTWDGVDKFQLISAAYESTPGVGIQIPGGGGGTVPEPTSLAIFGQGALGLAYRVRRQSQAKAQA